MAIHGLDQIRGGCFDAVERQPQPGLPIEFTWGNTRISGSRAGHSRLSDPVQRLRRGPVPDPGPGNGGVLNTFFLDHDNRGVFFRTSDDGKPIIEGAYGQKGGHSVAGYHAFELNYLAHLYTRSFVRPVMGKGGNDANFCLFFWPEPKAGRITVNVLPDFTHLTPSRSRASR
ncbi:MAG: hypothetical protein IPK83_19410 [Planctomycetes bacterium]|nr:hypothetical protein [Planctomycetota bacterium]